MLSEVAADLLKTCLDRDVSFNATLCYSAQKARDDTGAHTDDRRSLPTVSSAQPPSHVAERYRLHHTLIIQLLQTAAEVLIADP